MKHLRFIFALKKSLGSVRLDSHQLVPPAVIIPPGQRDGWARVHGQRLPALQVGPLHQPRCDLQGDKRQKLVVLVFISACYFIQSCRVQVTAVLVTGLCVLLFLPLLPVQQNKLHLGDK